MGQEHPRVWCHQHHGIPAGGPAAAAGQGHSQTMAGTGRKEKTVLGEYDSNWFFTIRYKMQLNLMLLVVAVPLNRRKQCNAEAFVPCSMTSDK